MYMYIYIYIHVYTLQVATVDLSHSWISGRAVPERTCSRTETQA